MNYQIVINNNVPGLVLKHKNRYTATGSVKIPQVVHDGVSSGHSAIYTGSNSPLLVITSISFGLAPSTASEWAIALDASFPGRPPKRWTVQLGNKRLASWFSRNKAGIEITAGVDGFQAPGTPGMESLMGHQWGEKRWADYDIFIESVDEFKVTCLFENTTFGKPIYFGFDPLDEPHGVVMARASRFLT
mmetsp:Transcript_19739/g.63479  ORF Transcript_19739/g.63479 Transcript_19739/m.63479 type:complete len:189 (+) Transcript_19739:100-666(+)